MGVPTRTIQKHTNFTQIYQFESIRLKCRWHIGPWLTYTLILRASLSLGCSSRLDPFPLSAFSPRLLQEKMLNLSASQCFLLKNTDHREHCSLTNAFGFSLQWPDCTLSWARRPCAPLLGMPLLVLLPSATRPAGDPVDSDPQPSI